MITSSQDYPFGGRVTVIKAPKFVCMVSTAKEGIFQKQSTMIAECSEDLTERRHVGKIVYADSLRSADRLRIHNVVVTGFDEIGSDGSSFSYILGIVCSQVKESGYAKEAINSYGAGSGLSGSHEPRMPEPNSTPAHGGNVEMPPQMDLDEIRASANHGEAAAEHSLGVCYFKGWGVRQDYAAAAKWFRKAADQDYTIAQSNLGAMLYAGRGIPQNKAEAAKYCRRAADRGDSTAQQILSIMRERGEL